MPDLQKFVNLKPTDRVLDIGCAAGDWALALAGRAAYVTGLVVCEEGAAEASALAIRTGADNVSFQSAEGVPGRGDHLQHLDFPDASFDWVTCLWVLHRIDDSRRAIGEMVRVLKTPGRMLLVDDVGAEDADKRATHLRIAQSRDADVRNIVTPQQVRRTLVEQGLTIEREEDWNVRRRFDEWMRSADVDDSVVARTRRYVLEAQKRKSTDWQIGIHGKTIEFTHRCTAWVALKLG